MIAQYQNFYGLSVINRQSAGGHSLSGGTSVNYCCTRINSKRINRYLIVLIFIAGWLDASASCTGNLRQDPASIAPPYTVILIPDSGFTPLTGEDYCDITDSIAAKDWIKMNAGINDLFVAAEGPSGSGRFWAIVVGIADSQFTHPVRGVCLTTSTVGWRTLQRYSKGVLSWLEDVDGDGKSEFILWDSFPLGDQVMSMGEFGLMAWVFRLISTDSLVVDIHQSQILAESLAKEYNLPLEGASRKLLKLRYQAAETLERFARSLLPYFQNR